MKTPKRYYFLAGTAYDKKRSHISISTVIQAKDPEEAQEVYVTQAHKEGMKEVLLTNIELIDII